MRGRLSVPRAADLAAELPYGSQTWLAVESDAAWTTEAHHLGFVLDALALGNWQRGGGSGEKPKPWPRPSQMKAEREQQDAMLARLEASQRRRERRAEARRQQQLNQPD